jgi:cardiolipin synthase
MPFTSSSIIHGLIWIAGIGVAFWAWSHAMLHRRDPRAALWWSMIIWTLPFAGSFLYYIIGINRIQRRIASTIAARRLALKKYSPSQIYSRIKNRRFIPTSMRHLFSLSKISEQVSQQPLLHGNTVTPLRNGDEAYTAMLKTIDKAQRSVSLSTYIFRADSAGELFIDALRRAKERGVEVRVLMDDVGSAFSFSKAGNAFKDIGIPVASFMPTFTIANLPYLNLRNHRKLLVVDGEVGFCGGMNIHKENMIKENPDSPTNDFHFKLEGPVVAQMQAAFAEDWAFSTKEKLKGDLWFPSIASKGEACCRGIADGPDESLERLRWILLGAINVARESIHIVSPYFIPDQSLLNALCLAALRGVDVNIILPSETDWMLVNWASMSSIQAALDGGCKVWNVPPPFDHTKLMLVDGGWTLFGSSNWDTRSLRLNFEFNVECYDKKLNETLMAHLLKRLKNGRELTVKELEDRPLPIKLRDGVARLFAPHL